MSEPVPLCDGDQIILFCGMSEEGAMSADWADATTEACMRLEDAGLLEKTHRVEHIQFWRTTQAGKTLMRGTLQ